MNPSQLSAYLGVVLLGCGLLTTAVADPVRTWTNTHGKTMEARLLSTDATKATIDIERTDGVRFTLAIDQLSPADQQFLQDGPPASASEKQSQSSTELTQEHWDWLQRAGTIAAQNYTDTPIADIAAVLNARLRTAKSPQSPAAIKSVRIAPLAKAIKIYGQFPATVDLATYLKELAFHNDLQLRLDANQCMILQSRLKDKSVKFLEP